MFCMRTTSSCQPVLLTMNATTSRKNIPMNVNCKWVFDRVVFFFPPASPSQPSRSRRPRSASVGPKTQVAGARLGQHWGVDDQDGLMYVVGQKHVKSVGTDNS